jgi:hypothetical protein
METNQAVNRLVALRQNKKFTKAEWNERGLNPSSPAIIQSMTLGVNQCLDRLLETHRVNPSKPALTQVLVEGLTLLNRDDYDTEEREWMVDSFAEIAEILSIDIDDELNIWLYGKALAAAMKQTSKPAPVLRTESVNCPNCQETLSVKVTEFNPDPNSTGTYFIARCNRCSELSLVPSSPGAKRLTTENFVGLKPLSWAKYTEAQALEALADFKKSNKHKK